MMCDCAQAAQQLHHDCSYKRAVCTSPACHHREQERGCPRPKGRPTPEHTVATVAYLHLSQRLHQNIPDLIRLEPRALGDEPWGSTPQKQPHHNPPYLVHAAVHCTDLHTLQGQQQGQVFHVVPGGGKHQRG